MEKSIVAGWWSEVLIPSARAGAPPRAHVAALQHPGSGAAVDADALAIADEAATSGVPPGAAAGRRSCCTKPSAGTWAALTVTAVQGAGSAEAVQGAPRLSDDLRIFRPHP